MIEARCDRCGETFNPSPGDWVLSDEDNRRYYRHGWSETLDRECNGFGIGLEVIDFREQGKFRFADDGRVTGVELPGDPRHGVFELGNGEIDG